MYPEALHQAGLAPKSVEQSDAVLRAVELMASRTPAPAPAIVADSLSLATLAKGLPNKHRREFEGAVKPLGTESTQPARQDLQPFWRRVFEACEGMGPGLNPHDFTAVHIARIAPVILGEAAWSLMAATSYSSWAEFQAAVERRYGLSRAQCVEKVFRMKPTAGEHLFSFWLRVEDERARYQVSKSEVYRKFITDEASPELAAELAL